ncbi:MAG: DUF3052 domain-containing protein [Chloroflexi bacterium]|nr:DUF3052 domain-containing protein [Chloroflexota bacterium]
MTGHIAKEAGYSGTLNAPSGAIIFRPRKLLLRDFDLVLFFTDRRSDLQARFEELGRAIVPNGALWIAWPKKSSGVPTDLTEDALRDVGLPYGLVDNKVCAIDSTWSGLRFVWRLSRRG